MELTMSKANTTNIQQLFDSHKENQYKVGNTTAKERIHKLDKLHVAVETTYREALREAMYKDFKKHPSEVDLTEIYVVTTEIKHAKSHLKKWMSKEKVSTPMSMMGSSSWIHYEPKGVCLIISPWNFPLNLTFGPLVSAIAAGNTVMIKPSEYTPHTSAVMKKIIETLFPSNEIVVVEGGVETSTELLELPFNHIFFTGAPSIGKIVMKAAAKNLTSVTLELGGKSPTIVDETANLEQAAARIAWGKFLNNGQICIAPDYVFVHKSKKDEFVDLVGKKLKEFYGDDASTSDAYNRIVNGKHFERVRSYLEDSVEKGANIAYGGKSNIATNYMDPTVVTDVPLKSKLMEEEIFGPILPVNEYTDLQEAIDFINANEKPLALYIYSKNKKNINRIMDNTRAGGTCINNNDVHFFNTHLPFGGVNNSGIGKSHGFYGFQAFSNARSVYEQKIPGALELLMPPYNNTKQKLIDLTIKWF
ncbi:MAG: aldehyde dehydrogenase family protein [Chitinophagales bacterium]